MRLADFILSNIEPILMEWESFARRVWPGKGADSSTLRDHAGQILRAVARDMKSFQTAEQQSEKSKGAGDAEPGAIGDLMKEVADVHAVTRVRSGFDLAAVMAEYRALRASVIRLWRESDSDLHRSDLDDMTRFNESVDQSLTDAVNSYMATVDRSRQMFLAILGHDLRNPLNSVAMSAAVLSQSNLDPDAAEMASQITTSASAMADMIKDLLDFTAGELGGVMPLAPATMDVGRLCSEVVEEMRAAYPTRTLEIQAQDQLTGAWDDRRLRQVVSNLLGNAIQHGTGPVTLTVGAEGSGVCLTVHNGGAPIPPSALATVFEPLVRGVSDEPQKKRRPGSIGLGLYIAREVITAHGGTIEVASSAQAGTTFTVHLPRRAAKEASIATPA